MAVTDYRTLPETSAAQGLDHCNGCGACCRIAPCLLLPPDVSRIAEGLKITERQVLATVRIERRRDGRWQVRMAKPCHYLAGNACTIHDFKPSGGRDFRCWTENPQRYEWSAADLGAIGFRVT